MMNRNTLCIFGPHVGRHSGRVPSQGEILAEYFRKEGYDSIISASNRANRFVRLFDINFTALKNRKKINVVLAEVYGGRSFVVEDSLSLLCKWLKLPLVMTLHGGDMPRFMARYPRWAHRVLSRADALTAPSYYLIEAVAKYGFQAHLIPNIINLANYPYRLRQSVTPRLFWMRSFHDIYHPEMAINVLVELRKKYPEASLVMAGSEKGLQEPMRQLANELGIGHSVTFPGFLDMASKVQYGTECDFYLNTNRIDNMPVGVVEACAMGMIVVSTNVGGIPYLLTHKETGLLVPNGDVQAMTNAITRLIEDPKLAMKLSHNALEVAQKSSWECVRPQWENLITEVLGSPNY